MRDESRFHEMRWRFQFKKIKFVVRNETESTEYKIFTHNRNYLWRSIHYILVYDSAFVRQCTHRELCIDRSPITSYMRMYALT